MIFKRKKENILVVGNGEIGKAILKLYNNNYNVDVIDINSSSVNIDNVDVMNICIPYGKDFVKIVKKRTVSCPGTRVVARHA